LEYKRLAITSKRFRSDDRSLDIYLRDLGNTPLLKADEEIALAKRIHNGDQDALEQLTKANLRFVVSVAKQYQNQGLPLADLINEGNIGLIKAGLRFDETRGFKFISYAVWWIRQAILQAISEQSRIVRVPLNRSGTLYKIGKVSSSLQQALGREPEAREIASHLDLSEIEVSETLKIHNSHLSLDTPFTGTEDTNLLDVLPDVDQESPDDNLITESLRVEITTALATLTPREAEVISRYFGLNGERAATLEEIGERFGLTRERIRQIKEKAIRRLRHSSRSRSLSAYLS
jgi:RNA polymerase primary sigma factor